MQFRVRTVALLVLVAALPLHAAAGRPADPGRNLPTGAAPGRAAPAIRAAATSASGSIRILRGSGPGVLGGAATIAPDTTWFGGTVWNADSSRWEAIPGGTWTFDSGVGSSFDHTLPGVDPYKDPVLHARMEGWMGLDLGRRYQDRFRRLGTGDFSGTACVGSAAGLGGGYSFWCGLLEPEADSLCWAAGRGYGNYWSICIEKTFNYDGADTVALSYDFYSDTETGYDSSLVLVDTTGVGSAPDVQVAGYTGIVPASHEDLVLIPGASMRSTAGSYRVKFCFHSDEAYSDEDGLYATDCGPFAVDDVAVVGGGVSDVSDFEAGEDGWTAVSIPVPEAGDWSDIRALADLPALPESIQPCDLADSLLVFFDPATQGHPYRQDNIAVSPWIDLAAAGVQGLLGRVIETDFYADLPIANYLFAKPLVQWYPYTCPATGAATVSPWTGDGYVYYLDGVPSCRRPDGGPWRVDLSGVIPPDAQRVRIGLGVVNYCPDYLNGYPGGYPPCSGVTNPSPWFDNVRFGAMAYTSIQHALDLASPGDTVLVGPGTYTGEGNVDLDFQGKGVALMSSGGPEVTVIDCQGAGRGFLFQSGEDSTSRVQGFTVRHGEAGGGNGGGAWITGNSAPTFVECRFDSCHARFGGAVFVGTTSSTVDSSGVQMTDCVLSSCEADDSGGGFYARTASPVVVRGGRIENCVGQTGGGGYADGDSVLVEEVTIAANHVSGEGGGLKLVKEGTVRRTALIGNTASYAGGGIWYGRSGQFCGAPVWVVECTLSGNSSANGGGAYGCGGSWIDCRVDANSSTNAGGGGVIVSASLTDCWFTRNISGDYGGGILLERGRAEGCFVMGNSAAIGGGIAFVTVPESSPILEGCVITGNSATRGGGAAIYWDNVWPSYGTMASCTISGNMADEGGSIYLQTGFELTLDQVAIWGNCTSTAGPADTTTRLVLHCSAVDTSGLSGPGTVVYDGPQVFTNPVFCAPEPCANAPTTAGDYHLAANSPCLASASPCDTLIGALDEGCAVVGVPGETPPVVRPLLAAGPNPFRSTLTIHFAVPGAAPPEIRIYDVAGRLLRELAAPSPAGAVTWDGRDAAGNAAPAGIYFIRAGAPAAGMSTRVLRVP